MRSWPFLNTRCHGHFALSRPVLTSHSHYICTTYDGYIANNSASWKGVMSLVILIASPCLSQLGLASGVSLPTRRNSYTVLQWNSATPIFRSPLTYEGNCVQRRKMNWTSCREEKTDTFTYRQQKTGRHDLIVLSSNAIMCIVCNVTYPCFKRLLGWTHS
jgi:hypothetical protein